MDKLIYDSARCKGCYFCVAACPAKAVSITEQSNKKGYRIVAFDQAACRACGMCYMMCPDYAITVNKAGGAQK